MTTDQAATANPAQAYHEYFEPAIFAPLAEIVVELAAPKPSERVLDVACGTGIVARRVASNVASGANVIGIDINPAMIGVAQSLDPHAGGHPIEFRAGDAIALDVGDAAVDLSVCQQGLQFFADRAAAVGEIRRVLRPGGRAVAAVWKGLDHHPLYQAMAEAEAPLLQRAGMDVTAGDLVRPFSLGDPDELRDLFAAAGFSSVQLIEASIDARFADGDRFVERMELAYAAVVPGFASDPMAFQGYLAAVTEATEPLVAAHRRGGHVVVPMHTHLVVAS